MASIASLSPQAWWRADSITGVADGATVTDWPDASGNGWNGSGGNAVFYSNQSPTGLPALRFVRGQFTTGAEGGVPEQTVAAVVRINGSSGTRAIIGSTFQAGLEVRVDHGSNRITMNKGHQQAIATSAGSLTVNAWAIVLVTFKSATSYAFRINGALDSSGATGVALAPTSQTKRAIGNEQDEWFVGDIAEIVTWDRVLTASEILDVEAEITARWLEAAPPPSTGGTVVAVSATAGEPVVNRAAGGVAAALSSVVGEPGASAPTVEHPAEGAVTALSGVEGEAAVAHIHPAEGTVDAATSVAGEVQVERCAEGTVAAASSVTGEPAVIVMEEIDAESRTSFASTLADPSDLEEIEAESRTGFTSSVAVSLDVPETEHPEYSLKLVDRTGQSLGELENATLGTITRTRNGRHAFSFTLPKDDPKLAKIRQFSEVQVWIGRQMVPGAWFVIVDPEIDDGNVWRYQCAGIRWHLETRRIGKELPNLLRNGDFEAGTRFWHPRWYEGSAAEANPTVKVVTGAAALEGGKAIEVTGVESVTKKSVQSDAIFLANRPYADEPLANGFVSGGEQVIKDNIKKIPKGSAITVEGHTADADAGDGYALSVRRAEAAKAVILKARPDLKVTAVGKGETEQVAPNDTEANQAKNRRLVIIATITSIGHRQAVTQRLFYTPQADVRRSGELRLNGWVNLIDYVGPSKDGWLLYLGARKVNAKKDEPGDNSTSSIDEGFPVERWTPDGVTLGGLKPGQTYAIEVRLYPTAGKTRFDRVSLKPNLITAWYNKTRPEIIKGLVEHAQDPDYRKADVNIATNCKPFGTRTDEEYEWESRRTVDDCITDLLRGDGAPDFEVVVTQNRRVATTWANRGRRTHVPLKLGDIVTDYTSGIDGDKVASTAIVQASRSRGSKAEAFARTTRSDGLVLERLFDAEQDSTDSVCSAQARAALRHGRTDVITSVTCDPARTLWLLERVDLADICPVEIPDAGLDADGDYRIEEISLDLPNNRLTYRLAVEV